MGAGLHGDCHGLWGYLGADMTLTLNLGVIDIAYSDANYKPTRSPKARLGAAKRGKIDVPKTPSNLKTTGDVAEILEDKYHIMEIFYELHEDVITEMLAESMSDALESLANGAPATLNISAAGNAKIEELFKKWLSERGMDATMTPGVPTEAARKGVSHRFAMPYQRRPSRPSFIDTGLYVANFISWTET
jgi:hypothetical protein